MRPTSLWILSLCTCMPRLHAYLVDVNVHLVVDEDELADIKFAALVQQRSLDVLLHDNLRAERLFLEVLVDRRKGVEDANAVAPVVVRGLDNPYVGGARRVYATDGLTARGCDLRWRAARDKAVVPECARR